MKFYTLKVQQNNEIFFVFGFVLFTQKTPNSSFMFLKYATTQWKIISITSMEVDFWEVKSSGGENSHATEVKCSDSSKKLIFILKKKRNERQSRRKFKIFRFPFLISRQKRLFD
jgi:hypothetical protein